MRVLTWTAVTRMHMRKIRWEHDGFIACYGRARGCRGVPCEHPHSFACSYVTILRKDAFSIFDLSVLKRAGPLRASVHYVLIPYIYHIYHRHSALCTVRLCAQCTIDNVSRDPEPSH